MVNTCQLVGSDWVSSHHHLVTQQLTFSPLWNPWKFMLSVPVTSLLTWQLPVIKPYSFAKFQELIAVQTGVSAAQQKLFFKYDEFKPDPMAPSSSYPKTSVSMRTSNKVPSHIFILSYRILLCPSIHQLICLLLSGPT